MDSPDSKRVTVLGIDPGLNVTGYAVVGFSLQRPMVREAGIIRAAESGRIKADMAVRLRKLYDGISEVIDQYQPDVAAMEQLYSHYSHPQTAILMGHARGVLMLAASQRGLRVVSHAATQIKKTITGSGRASKEQVQRVIQRELRLTTVPEPPDVADALAVAVCELYLRRADAA
jgi:crossover junction endodeoxyribonuclease RuvC